MAEQITDPGLTQTDSQQPSSSKTTTQEEEMSKLLEEEKARKSRLQFSGINFILKFINSSLVTLTIRLHRVSRNYRFVMRVLAKEKKTLKSKAGFGAGSGTGMMWSAQAGSSR